MGGMSSLKPAGTGNPQQLEALKELLGIHDHVIATFCFLLPFAVGIKAVESVRVGILGRAKLLGLGKVHTKALLVGH